MRLPARAKLGVHVELHAGRNEINRVVRQHLDLGNPLLDVVGKTLVVIDETRDIAPGDLVWECESGCGFEHRVRQTVEAHEANCPKMRE